MWECKVCDTFNNPSIYQCKICDYLKPIEYKLQSLISGYIREIQDEITIFGIIKIIEKLYPVLIFKFGAHDEEKIDVLDDGETLKGKTFHLTADCRGITVYADLGISFIYKSRHYISLQNIFVHDINYR